ncbi:MAG TPA: prolipoprotein diacylglyceryl transferase [Candidatus Kapabacteria bacterium]|jgi:prolipoprotein diacylglyceryl transferase|nr:prolipoprotein diacylglyceryl transferase [Candidatus Kapabacteria bacterium]
MDIFLSLIHWNASPEIFNIGGITLRWYGLLFALGFVVGYLIMQQIFSKEGKTQKDLDALTVAMVLGTIVGARLGHCLFYEPTYYLSNPIKILHIWEGGLASHGGAIGILIALYFYLKRRPYINFLWLIDRLVIVTALAAAFIRLGNFFNSEIYGAPANVPWAVIFERVDSVPRHPSQIYEAVAYFIIFLILLLNYKKGKNKLKEGFNSGLFLILVFGFRFFVEFLKAPQVEFETQMALNMGQILSIPFIILGLYFLIRMPKKSN